MRLPRKDNALNEFIEHFDRHYELHQFDKAISFTSLNANELSWICNEVTRCRTDPRYYLENYHVIKTEDLGLRTLIMWEAQEIFYDVIMEIMVAGRPVRIICLKARQQGLSTVSQALVFHKTLFTEGCTAMVVAQDPDQSGYLFDKSRLALTHLPWWMQPEVRYEEKNKNLTFDRKDPNERSVNPGLNSEILVEAANKMCLCPGTMIPTVRGLLPIESLHSGDEVFAPSGCRVRVAKCFTHQSPLATGKRIRMWHNAAFPLEGTNNHPVLTPFGLERLDLLKPGSALLLPVRRIGSHGTMPTLELRPVAAAQMKRFPKPRPDREWGFLCGLYLAEGSVANGRGNTVTLALNGDERDLAERAAKACDLPLPEPHVQGGCRIYRLHNSWLGTWLRREFGTSDTKRIPDWVYGTGREFCLGLLEGMLRGDGHFCDCRNDVIFVTSRPLLALQFRELALALRLGLGGVMKAKTTWTHNGKKRTGTGYRVEFGADTGIAVRAACGERPNSVNVKHRNAQKWGWMPGGKYVWVQVKSTEDIPVSDVHDIHIESDDHLYCLPSAVTHNSGAGVGKTIRTAHLSEIGKWPNDPTILTQFLFPAMNASDELAFMESTARGRDQFFYDLWKAAVSGKLGWTPVFIEFFRVKKYSIPLEAGLELRRTSEENEIVERIKKDTGVVLDDGQLNWRRKKIEETVALEGSEWGFYQEYPINWHQAFQASGTCAFDKKKLNQLMLTRCCAPKWTGTAGLERDTRNNKWNPAIKLTPVPKGEDAPSQEQYGHNLYVWEQPDPRHGYYLSGDPSLGVEGGDPSCIQVMKIGRGKLPDEQVAEWWGHLSPSPFAEVAVSLAMWYNSAETALECNGEVGAMANNTLFRELGYDRVFQWKHYDKVKNFRTDFVGWYTDGDTRPKLIAKMREAIDDNKIILRSEALLDEMMAFSSVKKGRFEGQGMHDDRIMAMMIGRWCAHDSDWAIEISTTPIDDSKIFGYVCDFEVSHHWPSLQAAMQEGARPLPATARSLVGGTGYGCPICRSSDNRNSELKFIPKKDFANSEFSPVYDAPNGVRAGMVERGIPVHEIWPDEVSSGLPPTAEDAWKIL